MIVTERCSVNRSVDEISKCFVKPCIHELLYSHDDNCIYVIMQARMLVHKQINKFITRVYKIGINSLDSTNSFDLQLNDFNLQI